MLLLAWLLSVAIVCVTGGRVAGFWLREEYPLRRRLYHLQVFHLPLIHALLQLALARLLELGLPLMAVGALVWHDIVDSRVSCLLLELRPKVHPACPLHQDLIE